MRRPVEPLPTSPTPSSSPLSSARPTGPIEIRGSGNAILTFRVIPEVPAIHRSSMTIAIAGEPARDHSRLDLATDEAKVFLLALRDGDLPIVVVDSRTALRLEFAIAEDGPTFTVSKPGEERTTRRFNAGWSYDVKAMAAHLLADLGP
jgi:hypothetical protein